MSLVYNVIARYKMLSKRQKIVAVSVATVAALAILQWLSGA